MEKKKIGRVVAIAVVSLIALAVALHVGGSAAEMVRGHLSGAGM